MTKGPQVARVKLKFIDPGDKHAAVSRKGPDFLSGMFSCPSITLVSPRSLRTSLQKRDMGGVHQDYA